MEVAEQIVVMNEGRIEQIGAPRDVYERPATDFVMGFVGPVTRVDGVMVRPHDVDIRTEPAAGVTEALIERVLHLGFEVRVELVTGDGVPIYAQITRQAAEELELRDGQIVYIRPSSRLQAVA